MSSSNAHSSCNANAVQLHIQTTHVGQVFNLVGYRFQHLFTAPHQLLFTISRMSLLLPKLLKWKTFKSSFHTLCVILKVLEHLRQYYS